CDALLAPLLQNGKVYGLHALLVASGGRHLFERYWEGEDWNLGIPLGRVAYGPYMLHDLRSVSKSIVGMLYGIALAEGKVPPTGGQSLRPVSRICRPRKRAGTRPPHDRACPQHDARHRMGRAHSPLSRSAQ